MKTCKVCNKKLALSEFSFRKDTGKHRNGCKNCRTLNQRKYYEKNKNYFINDAKNRRNANPELAKERNRNNYWNHKEKRNSYNKEYYEKNKDKLLKESFIRHKKRLKTDISYRLIVNARTRTRDALRGELQTGTCTKAIGCTGKELKLWLEQKFYPNPETGEMMSWENYGYRGWHMDHRIPLSSGKTEEEILKLAHYTNIQPMWGKENMKKKAKLIY